MRRFHLPVLVVLLLAVPGVVRAQRTIDTGRAASPAGSVRIHNLAGSVRVSGWDRDSIAVIAELSVANVPFDLNVSGDNAKLGVWADAADAPAARLDVRVPRGSRVWIKTAGAPVTVVGVIGGVDVSTVAGAIRITGEPAEVYAESMGGAIEIEVASRLLRARTAGSDITIRGRITDAEAYTVSGLLTILNKEVGRGRFESVDGGIRYTGGIPRSSSVEFVSHSGNVELAVPTSLAADVRISSFQGTVRSELGRLVRSPAATRGAEYALTLGGGGAEIVVRTFKGAVSIRPM